MNYNYSKLFQEVSCVYFIYDRTDSGVLIIHEKQKRICGVEEKRKHSGP